MVAGVNAFRPRRVGSDSEIAGVFAIAAFSVTAHAGTRCDRTAHSPRCVEATRPRFARLCQRHAACTYAPRLGDEDFMRAWIYALGLIASTTNVGCWAAHGHEGLTPATADGGTDASPASDATVVCTADCVPGAEVCGRDGRTYQCESAAACAGTSVASIGPCGLPNVCPLSPCTPNSHSVTLPNGCVACECNEGGVFCERGYLAVYDALGCVAECVPEQIVDCPPVEDFREGCTSGEQRDYQGTACAWVCAPIPYCDDVLECRDDSERGHCEPTYSVSAHCYDGCECFIGG